MYPVDGQSMRSDEAFTKSIKGTRADVSEDDTEGANGELDLRAGSYGNSGCESGHGMRAADQLKTIRRTTCLRFLIAIVTGPILDLICSAVKGLELGRPMSDPV